MIRFILRVLALGVMLTSIQAQAVVTAPDSAFAAFYSTVTAPGKQTIGFGSNGTPVVAPGVPSLATAGGPLQVSRTASLPLPAGARLPVTATAKISNIAIGSLLKKALPLVPYLGTGVALYEMAKEIGFVLSKNPDGSVSTLKPDPTLCTVSPCATYSTYTYNGATVNTGLKSAAAAKADWEKWVNDHGDPQHPKSFTWYEDGRNFYACENGSCYYTGGVHFDGNRAPDAGGSGVPSSTQELVDAIAANSGWPAGSAVSQAVVDAQKVTGDTIPTDQPTISGPASVAGPVSVATTPYQDMVKKSTKASNYDCTYVQGATVMEGGSAICSERSITTDELTKTDPVTGNKTTTTTTAEDATKPADIPKDPEQAQATDSPLPSQPTLYKRKYPDGLTGVWTAQKSALLSSPLIQLTSNLQPTITGNGGYPSWSIPIVIGSKNWGTFDASPAPFIWDFLKVCTILGALFLARALIFGG